MLLSYNMSAAPFFSPTILLFRLFELPFSGVYFSVLLLFVVVYITHCLYTVPWLNSSRPPANQDKYTYLIMMELFGSLVQLMTSLFVHQQMMSSLFFSLTRRRDKHFTGREFIQMAQHVDDVLLKKKKGSSFYI